MSAARQPSLFDQPASPGPPLAAYARSGLAVREVARKGLLNRGGIDNYSFNCYTGCSNGCVYCYARFMQHEERFRQEHGPMAGQCSLV